MIFKVVGSETVFSFFGILFLNSVACWEEVLVMSRGYVGSFDWFFRRSFSYSRVSRRVGEIFLRFRSFSV